MTTTPITFEDLSARLLPAGLTPALSTLNGARAFRGRISAREDQVGVGGAEFVKVRRAGAACDELIARLALRERIASASDRISADAAAADAAIRAAGQRRAAALSARDAAASTLKGAADRLATVKASLQTIDSRQAKAIEDAERALRSAIDAGDETAAAQAAAAVRQAQAGAATPERAELQVRADALAGLVRRHQAVVDAAEADLQAEVQAEHAARIEAAAVAADVAAGAFGLALLTLIVAARDSRADGLTPASIDMTTSVHLSSFDRCWFVTPNTGRSAGAVAVGDAAARVAAMLERSVDVEALTSLELPAAPVRLAA